MFVTFLSQPFTRGNRMGDVPKGFRVLLESLVVALFVVVAFGLALFLGADRLVPCGEKRGLDALYFDLGHVDGPPGGGGCIVPTAGAWTMAVTVAALPVVVWIASIIARNRRSNRII